MVDLSKLPKKIPVTKPRRNETLPSESLSKYTVSSVTKSVDDCSVGGNSRAKQGRKRSPGANSLGRIGPRERKSGGGKYMPKHTTVQSLQSDQPVSPVKFPKKADANANIETASVVSQPQPQRRSVEWSPYTLKDYRKISPDKYVKLGGLGPFNIGSEDWQRRQALAEKRKEYSQKVRYSGAVISRSQEFV